MHGRRRQDEPLPAAPVLVNPLRPRAAKTFRKGSVSTRASKHERHQAAIEEVRLCGLQNALHRRGGAEGVEAAIVGGDRLVIELIRTEEVAEFVVASDRTHLSPRMGRYRPMMPRWSCFSLLVR